MYGITEMGAAAEFTVAPESAIGTRPRTLEPAQAAVVPLAGMTAWQALFDHGHLVSGERVLIHAAAGGVGTYAIQLAKWKGRTSGPQQIAPRRGHELGADEVIDYRERPFDDLIHGMDLVLHSIGQDQVLASLSCLKEGGRLVAISSDPFYSEAHRQGKTSMQFTMQPNSHQLEILSKLIDQGVVRPVIEKMVSLKNAPEAMEDLQRGHTLGKIGVLMS